ncbi:MAG TPA: hypothetical protein VMX18_02735 [Candidatus Bipolaricaulota bacterium]|nr:hypothetical protein [Candidatus Bipolaricaulota bacterium]
MEYTEDCRRKKLIAERQSKNFKSLLRHCRNALAVIWALFIGAVIALPLVVEARIALAVIEALVGAVMVVGTGRIHATYFRWPLPPKNKYRLIRVSSKGMSTDRMYLVDEAGRSALCPQDTNPMEKFPDLGPAVPEVWGGEIRVVCDVHVHETAYRKSYRVELGFSVQDRYLPKMVEEFVLFQKFVDSVKQEVGAVLAKKLSLNVSDGHREIEEKIHLAVAATEKIFGVQLDRIKLTMSS